MASKTTSTTPRVEVFENPWKPSIRRITDADGRVTWQREEVRRFNGCDLRGTTANVLKKIEDMAKNLEDSEINTSYESTLSPMPQLFFIVSGWKKISKKDGEESLKRFTASA